MKLANILNDLKTGKIDEPQAAALLGISVKSLRGRITKGGERLPLTLAVLDKIRADEISRDEAIELLGVCARQVNKLAQSWGVERPIKEYLVRRSKSEIKWEIRKKFAIDYIAGGLTLEEAAERMEVSDRQVRRWVSELLMKHFEMPWKDLEKVTTSNRKRLANEIEKAEGIEYAQASVINAIARGNMTLEQEATQRAVAKKTARRQKNV